MDTIPKDKIRAAIAQIENRQEAVERRLASLQKTHRADWLEYGSALCAGEMLKKEEVIQEEIDAFENDLSLLMGCLTGRVSLESTAADRAELADIERIIELRKADAEAIRARLSDAARAKQLLGSLG